MALLLYQHLNRPEDAIGHMEQAIAVLAKTGLPQDAAGHTVEDLQGILHVMRTGSTPDEQGGNPYKRGLKPSREQGALPPRLREWRSEPGSQPRFLVHASAWTTPAKAV